MKPDSPDVVGPEGNLQLSQDLGGFLHASLKLTTHRHLLLEYFVKKSSKTMKNSLILPSLLKILILMF